MLLQINHITKTYNVNSSFKRKKQTVLNDISLSLNKGDSIALIGESGCGKSTLGKIIAGLLHPDSGEITFFGKPFAEHEFAVKQQIGFVSGGIDF